MTKLHSMGLIALCLMAGGCTSYVDVDVTVVDAVSRAPIPNVRVEQSFIHYEGIKRMSIENTVLGTTDVHGAFKVGDRDMYSKEYTISFFKEGYDKTWLRLFVVKGEGSKYRILWPRKNLISMGKATDSTKLVIPMRRKR